MGILQVALFGGLRLTHDNWQTEVLVTRDIQALLAYLLLKRHKVHVRDVLAGLFWERYSQERARGSLNTALWKLKKVLEPKGIPAGTYLKTTHQGGLAFNRESSYWLDIEVFENDIHRVLAYPLPTVKDSQIAALEKTMALYTGEPLEGLYKDWALRERERLRGLYLTSLIYLLQYYGVHHAYETAISYGQRILELDPLREEVHREMMRLYLGNGQRALAIRQYEICRTTLDEELGIAPMEDTQALHRQIFSQGKRKDLPLLLEEDMSVEELARQLKEATQNLDLAKERLRQAYQLITRFSDHEDGLQRGRAD